MLFSLCCRDYLRKVHEAVDTGGPAPWRLAAVFACERTVVAPQQQGGNDAVEEEGTEDKGAGVFDGQARAHFGGDGDGEVVSLQYSWAVVVANKMKQVNKEVVVDHIYPSSRSERRGSAVRDIA